MQYFVARAATALLITISASIGVQNTSTNEQPIPSQAPTPNPTVLAVSTTNEASPAAQIENQKKLEREARVEKLQQFLQKYNSPMTNNAQDFIDAAEQYELDWRLLPSIAGVESTFGKHVPYNSYNPFGWGNGSIHFDSWRDAIFTVGKGLGEKYYKRGLRTPHQIQRVYAPPSTTWGNKVTFFMNKIEPESVVVPTNSPTPAQ